MVEPNLRIMQDGGVRFLRWDAGASGLQLKRGEQLDNLATWVDVPAVIMRDGSWGALADLSSPKGFYALFAAGIPAAPEDVSLVMVRSDFRIEWFPEFDAARYWLFISKNPSVSPTNYDQVLDVGSASRVTVTGLDEGERYYFVLVAQNESGQSLPSATFSGVFGPNGPVTGYAAYSHSQLSGEPFYVRAANVLVKLKLENDPPGAPTYSATTDVTGQFAIPAVPAGNYEVNWVAPDGQPGPSPTILKVTGDGAALTPLAIPGLPQSIHGKVKFESGEPAAIDDELWDLHHHAQIVAHASGGQLLASVTADSRGGFALPPLPSDKYPVTLTVTYQSLTQTHVVSKEPNVGESWMLPPICFEEILPKVTGISFWQNGVEVTQVEPGIPVEFRAIVDNPDKLTENFRWDLVIDGKTEKKNEAEPVFTFDPITTPGGPDSESVTVRLNVSDLVHNSHIYSATFERIFRPITSGCYSGLVGAWDPANPNVITPLHPANVTIKDYKGATLTKSTLNSTGYFESTITDTSFNYVIRAEKEGYMRFLWPFERLPTEPLFPLVPLETTSHTFDGNPLLVTRTNGIELGILGLQTVAGAAYTGTIKVSTATFDPTVRHPMPPSAVTFDSSQAQSLEFGSKCAWVEVRGSAGELLVPNANLVWTSSVIAPFDLHEPVFMQNETTGYFESAGSATKAKGGTNYMLPITKGGFYSFARAYQWNELAFAPDRSLNYPFHVLVGASFFPVLVTLDTFADPSVYIPRNLPIEIKVLDLRQAPGLHYPDPGNPTTPTPAFSKNIIIRQTITPQGTAPYFFHFVDLSIGSSIPALLRAPATRVTDLADQDHFLAHPSVSNVTREAGARSLTPYSEGERYYKEIRAPRTFAGWKRENGFPEKFGDPMPDVAPDDYAFAYYYNLGDLGFARAQSMRVKIGADGLPNVAFYVTNYRSLEDARCNKNAVASVCMDYAYLSDEYRVPHRHTRFYVYGAGGGLIPTADLDGAGQKAVPGLCITCHGGTKFNPDMRLLPLSSPLPQPPVPEGSPPRPRPREYIAPTGDLGSRFLPFDLESYTFHPAFGVQHLAFARMNAAVLKTFPDSTPSNVKAIPATIAAWYGNSNPLANPYGYNIHARPAGWPVAANYDAFKVGCRVCHISRDLGTGPQFADNAHFTGYDYALCTSLYMPNSQRTWSTFWGTAAARALGDTNVVDLPALLHYIEGGSGSCPSLSR